MEEMLRAPPPPRYQEWLEFHFGRHCEDAWDLEWEFSATPQELAALVTCTFVNCGRDLAQLSDLALAVGLKVILDIHHSDIAHTLASEKLDSAQHLGVIRSLRWLYKDCLAIRSPPVLGHLSESADSPLEYITFMLWDVSPLDRLIAIRDPSSGASALVDTLSAVLCERPRNPACMESILHGLGHMVLSFPSYRDEIHAAIDKFLSTVPIERKELISYAAAARTGHIR